MAIVVGVSIFLLGKFECYIQKQPDQINLARKTRALLAYLASSNIPHHRQHLYNMFCQETENPSATLRWHLSRIRREVSDHLLIADNDTVQFDHQAAWVDQHLFHETITQNDLQNMDTGDLIETINLYRGEFLGGLNLPDAPEFEIWLLAERTRFQQLYERGLSALVDQYIARNDYESAAAWSQKLLQSNPLLETAHASMMWLYARMGQREAALNQFEHCKDLLVRELAVEPTHELIALHEAIKAGQLRQIAPLFSTYSAVSIDVHNPKRAVLFGRETEISQLKNIWHRTRHSGNATVLVEAEAGGGKTYLIKEFADQLSGDVFLIGQCYESSRNMPYRPWIDVLEMWIEHFDDTSLQSMSRYWLEQLSLLLPTLAVRVNIMPHRKQSGNQEHLFAAVVELLLKMPDSPPIALFIDDLQWADEISLDLFHYMAQRAHRSDDTPLLLLGAWRTEEVQDNPALLSILDDLRHGGEAMIIDLPPLSGEHLEAMIHHASEKSLSEQEIYRIRDALVRETGGNPLFASEILTELNQQEDMPASLPIPPGLDALIQRRMRQLSASEQQVLEALAVLDTPSTVSQAQQSSGRSEDETIMAIEQGLQWRLLEAVGKQNPPHFDFKHDLMREAISSQISLARRQRLHRRVAMTLCESGAAAATLAYHWHIAGDTREEAFYVSQAATDAVAVYANDEALRYINRALELISDTGQRAHLHMQLADVQQLIGQWAEAGINYGKALDLAQASKARKILPRIQLQIGWLRFDEGDVAEALTFFEHAKEGFTAIDDASGIGDSLNAIGQAMMQFGDFAKAIDYFEQYHQLASDNNDKLAMSKALANLGVVFIYQDNYRRAVQYMEQSLELSKQFNDKRSTAGILGNLASLYQEKLYDYERVLLYREQSLHMCIEIGDVDGVSLVMGNTSALYCDLGQYELALAYAKQELAIGIEMNNLPRISVSLSHIADAFAKQGQIDEAGQIYRFAIQLGQSVSHPYIHCVHLQRTAKIVYQQGDYTEAREINNRAIHYAQEVQRHGVLFDASVLDIKLQLALKEIDTISTIERLESLLNASSEERGKALIYYELWQLALDEPQKTTYGESATTLYHGLYEQTQIHDYRICHDLISKTKLAIIPVPLRDVPKIKETPHSLEILLDMVEQLLPTG